MAEMVADCIRCGANHTTFDVLQSHVIGVRYGWKKICEAFCLCRRCARSTVFVIEQRQMEHGGYFNGGIHSMKGNINEIVDIDRAVTLRDVRTTPPPEHLPADIEAAFNEGAACLAIDCFNAAATMFRLCIDHATRDLLPQADERGLNSKIRRSLGLRLEWLFNQNMLPGDLRELSKAIKEDGNDGAHVGNLTGPDAEDVLDFTVELLERLYTKPERIKLAEQRRLVRRASPSPP